jgi:deazaflavin-dependent oxidoreductase (nitroreductase family)
MLCPSREPCRVLRHIDPMAPRGRIYRAYARLVSTRGMAWLSRHIGWKVDPILMRLTGGRVGFGFLLPTAVLETRGARTGLLRRNVVIYFHDGDRVTIVASHAGAPNHPSWYHNLRANPEVVFGGVPMRATVVSDDAERTRLWGLADRVFAPYAAYRQRTAAVQRTIPIVQLTAR